MTEIKVDDLQTQIELRRADIKSQLESFGVPLAEWGKGNSKKLDHLVKEILEGESILTTDDQGRLIRQINVIGINVMHRGQDGRIYKLVEEKQVFQDGRVRQRSLDASLGEKIKPGEDLDEAAQRAIQEELGIDAIPVHFRETVHVQKKSDSYPGLNGEYINHFYDAWVGDEQFSKEGYTEIQPDKTTFFSWKEVEDTDNTQP